jgi:hypothetical protein
LADFLTTSVFDLEEKKREKKENYGNHKTSVGIFI